MLEDKKQHDKLSSDLHVCINMHTLSHLLHSYSIIYEAPISLLIILFQIKAKVVIIDNTGLGRRLDG